MTTPATPSNPQPAGDDRNLVPVDPSTAVSAEDKASLLWDKYRNLVLGVCVVALVAILAKGGWEYMQRQKDLGVQNAYAAATTTEQLKTFAAANTGHPLAGVAQVRIADEAYTAGKSADALAAYEKAIPALAGSPLAARARMGRAMAQAQAGKSTDATTELKALAADTNQLAAVRAEAMYHLASLAAETGNGAEVQKLSTELMQLDPSSVWSNRAMSLRASMPVVATPAINIPVTAPQSPATKKDDSSSDMRVKLPGK